MDTRLQKEHREAKKVADARRKAEEIEHPKAATEATPKSRGSAQSTGNRASTRRGEVAPGNDDKTQSSTFVLRIRPYIKIFFYIVTAILGVVSLALFLALILGI